MSEHHDCDACGACIRHDPKEACCHEIEVGGGFGRRSTKTYFFDLCQKCSKKFFRDVFRFVPRRKMRIFDHT